MIRIENVSKSFGSLNVLKEISLTIPEGAVYGLVGRSGVGKSTLLRCINGLEKYDDGSLQVNDIEVGDLSGESLRKFRKDVGMIFQNFSLVSRASVFNNIAMPLKCWGYGNRDIKKRVEELLDLVGIPEKIYSKSRELSGGQKQRVAIARALALEPQILLCDEATSALDPKSTESIIELLSDVNKKLGITIVVVTHEMDVVRKLCDSMAIMEDGRIRACGNAGQLFKTPPVALQNLLGTSLQVNLPVTGKNIKINYFSESEEAGIASRLARTLGIDFLVVGKIQRNLKQDMMDTLILNIKEEDADRVEQYLDQSQITWNFI